MHGLRNELLKQIARWAVRLPMTLEPKMPDAKDNYFSTEELADLVEAPLGLVEDVLRSMQQRREIDEICPDHWDLCWCEDTPWVLNWEDGDGNAEQQGEQVGLHQLPAAQGR